MPFTLPELLQRKRKDLKLTQEAVAESLDVDQSTYAHWESGSRLPSPRHLAAFLAAVSATEEEQGWAWAGLAEADRDRSERKEASEGAA